MAFGDQLAAFRKKVEDRHAKIKRGAALDLFTNVVIGTPVHRGVLRNNWFCAIGVPSDETTSAGAPVGTATINRIKDVLKNVEGLAAYQSIYLTNNLPYAEPIEYGHSRQAPEGMVRINALSWERLVAENAKKLK